MVEVKEIVELNRNIVVSLATLRKDAIIIFFSSKFSRFSSINEVGSSRDSSSHP